MNTAEKIALASVIIAVVSLIAFIVNSIYLPQEPTPTPTTGSISVSSSPSGASIYLDGNYEGITPTTIEKVEEGSYTITLKYTGYQDWSQTISVRSGDTIHVSPSFTSKPTPTPTPTIGSISISSSPSGASIDLDGSYQGITPMTIESIEVGSYTITLEYSGYQNWSQTIYVVAGETTNVIASPTPYEHSISNIQLDPPSGGVFIKTIQVEVTFDYTTAETGGVRIFVLPYTDGSRTSYTSSESPLYPAGQGKGEGDFTIQSRGVTVDKIRFKMTSADKSRVLYESFISVNYRSIQIPDEAV